MRLSSFLFYSDKHAFAQKNTKAGGNPLLSHMTHINRQHPLSAVIDSLSKRKGLLSKSAKNPIFLTKVKKSLI